jgi:hypothetical protein
MLGSSASEDRLEAVVLDGRKRLLLQAALRDTLLGVTIGMAGWAALLAFGTDYVPFALLWLFAAAGVAAGIVHWKRSQPPAYRVAQLLDRRWHTDDQVSTAYYFLKESARTGLVAQQQRSAARDLAAAGDLVAALPLRFPRAAWGVLAMLALSSLLFVVRYALQPTLSFERPLPAMLMRALLGPEGGQTDPALQPEPDRPPPGEEESAPSLNEEGETRDREARPSPPQPAEVPEALASPNDPLNVEIPDVEGLSTDEPYGDEMDYKSLVEAEQQGKQQGDKGQSPSDAGKSSDQDSAQANQDSKADPWNQENQSLLDRLKEAFQNMLSKMNMEPPKGPPSDKADSNSDSNAESSGEKAEASEGTAQGGASQSAEAQMEGGESGQPSSQQIAQGEGGNSSEQPGQGQPASAAGSNDGSKEAAEQAEIEEAMGRLEELYSRRAEEMRGEVMIETEKAQQSARTPYQPKAAGHQDLGGTVSRDAIPLAYQSYIKSYFENLRTKN